MDETAERRTVNGDASMATAPQTKILHIGAGVRTQTLYLPVFRELQQRGVLQIVGVATRNAERQTAVRAAGFPVVEDWRAALQAGGVDAVTVVVPPAQMADILTELLDYRRPLLHETPLGRPVGKATALIKKIRAAGILVATAEQQVFYPEEQLKRQIIASGQLGKVIAADNHHHTFAYHGVAKLRRYFPNSRLIALRAWTMPQPDGTQATQTNFKFQNDQHATMLFGPSSKNLPRRSPLRSLNIEAEGGGIFGDTVFLREGATFDEFHFLRRGLQGDLQRLECENGARVLSAWDNPYAGAKFSDDEIGLAVILERFCAAARGEGQSAYSAEEHYLDLLATQAMELSRRCSGLRLRLSPEQPRLATVISILTDASIRQLWLLAKWGLKKIVRR